MRPIHFLAVFTLLPLAGCVASYDHTDVSQVSMGHLGDNLASGALTMKEADVVVVRVQPYNSDNKPMIGNVVSDDPTIVEVLPAEGAGNFAFLGVHPGPTELRLLADGVDVGVIKATVSAQ